MYTSYSVSQAEQNCMPLPDYIIVNGKAAAEVLTHSGFDPGMILIGGALRYPHLFREPLETAVNSQKRQSRNAVITASSAGFEEALELIFYTIHTFGKFTEIPVILKLHPTIPVKAVLRHLKQIPINFSFSDEPLEFLIGKCMFFMYTSSAAALEAFAGGATLIHVKSEYRIDMNIFDNEESILSVDSGLEIDSAFIQMLKDKRSPGQNERKSIINKYFMPVNESVYQLFINT
jgi:surface carbohydrate biosynthesis protein (TIGR04326 family)